MRPEKYELAYQPVLDDAHVVRVNTTDLDAVDHTRIAAAVKAVLSSQID